MASLLRRRYGTVGTYGLVAEVSRSSLHVTNASWCAVSATSICFLFALLIHNTRYISLGYSNALLLQYV